MASEGSMEKFCTRLSVLQNLVYIWEQEHDVTVADVTAIMCSDPIIQEGTTDAVLECFQTDQRRAVTETDQRRAVTETDPKRAVTKTDQRREGTRTDPRKQKVLWF